VAKRGFLAWFADAVTSTSSIGYSGPDPDRPAQFGDSASQRRADRYVGTGQPRQYPDPQRIASGAVLAVIADDERPLARGSPAGGRTVTTVDHRDPEPIGAAQMTSINVMYGAGQAGKLGEVRWGLPGMPRDRVYDGELGPLQAMHGAQTVGQDMLNVSPGHNLSTFRGGMMTGLPSSSGMASMPLNDVQSVLAETYGY
jgi:hypothetical protein